MTITVNAELWIDDPQNVGYNCDGNVTDAVCCMDHLCDHLSQSACQDERPRNLLCRWDPKSQKCSPSKDSHGNVCCQTDPAGSACHDILINQKCPEGYEVFLFTLWKKCLSLNSLFRSKPLAVRIRNGVDWGLTMGSSAAMRLAKMRMLMAKNVHHLPGVCRDQ